MSPTETHQRSANQGADASPRRRGLPTRPIPVGAERWYRYQKRVAAGGETFNLIDCGSGPALVLIHGLACCWQTWIRNLEEFSRDHRVIAIDLPGFGESPHPQGSISIPNYARAIDALCDELELDRVTVIGHSLGGFVGAQLACAYPERVDRLVLVSAAALWNENRQARPLATFARVTEAVGAWGAARWEVAALRPRLRRVVLAPLVESPDSLPGWVCYEIMRGSGADGFVGAVYELASYRLRDRLPQIDAPTHIIWGRRDRLVSVSDAGQLQDLIPGASKQVFDATGHFPMVERPTEFDAEVTSFLHGS